ncbi:alkaline phosphatase family protein [Phormidium pseudopriestleyi FRX01]|uniref:Alkaline phosphatase family protein n=1 Tax=Phormidium pseudopriestleyi FRX01 TaxID=1759528 RepID=A0ABS3FMV1_9CYAN|nr:alkaline phosphatase family protein [Phormidium pseudopriestleyi]MBO0348441.1 alkaline phosphatase family protein [Phormidium pseudopriestleyi FRX01]
MKNPVIAIGLDAADPELLETWMNQGYLGHLKQLKDRGAYGRLTNLEYYKAETPWTTFLTGCLPNKTGYWSPVKFHEGSYNVSEIGAYNFQEYPPFYALGEEYRVAVFDVPQSRLCDRVNGEQVLAWGAHSPQSASLSHPPELLDQLNRDYGKHPALHRDHGDWWDKAYLSRLQKTLHQGIDRRGAIVRDLLKQERWDLLLTVFSETHSAGHDLWYLSQPDHPLYEHKLNTASEDPMLAVFEAVDRALGNLLAEVPEDAYLVVFSAHGSGNNTTDVPSMLFLPEFLYRFSFPGKVAIAPGKPGTIPEAIVSAPRRKTWTGEIWERKYSPNPLKQFLRQQLPSQCHPMLDRLLGTFGEAPLGSPEQLRQQGNPLFWQPATWYSPLWPQMKAFAIPSYSEGYIRINLAGREPSGIVSPEEYDSLCQEITAQLYGWTNARTGGPVVKKVIHTPPNRRTRPEADLIVIWNDKPADVIDCGQFGRIGPVPYRRTGSHRNRGFLNITGPGIRPGTQLREGHGVDLAPTILKLMNAPIPGYYDGTSLVEKSVLLS